MSRVNIYPDPRWANTPQLSQPTVPSTVFHLHIQKTHPPPSTLAKHVALSAGQSQNCLSTQLAWAPQDVVSGMEVG